MKNTPFWRAEIAMKRIQSDAEFPNLLGNTVAHIPRRGTRSRLCRGLVLAICLPRGLASIIAAPLVLVLVLMGCQGISHGPDQIPSRALTANPASFSFGKVVVGKTSSLNGNLSAAGATVTVTAAASTSSEFVISGITFPLALPAGQSRTFAVEFTPSVSGEATATLSFTSDAANSPTLDSLNGTGAPSPQHSVDLSWNANQSSDVIGYNVYRGDRASGPFGTINSSLDANTSYTDVVVSAGATYYYFVTAVDSRGFESGHSNKVKTVIPTP